MQRSCRGEGSSVLGAPEGLAIVRPGEIPEVHSQTFKARVVTGTCANPLVFFADWLTRRTGESRKLGQSQPSYSIRSGFLIHNTKKQK